MSRRSGSGQRQVHCRLKAGLLLWGYHPPCSALRFLLIPGLLFALSSCDENPTTQQPDPTPMVGCDGQTYPALSETPYVLPYAVGETYETGLANCSSSYHGAGQPDQYATDFDMPVGTPFVAARAGRVHRIVEDA